MIYFLRILPLEDIDMKRAFSLILAIIMIITLFTGCKGDENTETTSQSVPVSDTTEKATEKEPQNKGNINLLTGLYNLSDGAVGKRPVAVMINNLKGSLPQYGISSADIMYEIVTEGGITRMMAMYGDYTKVPNVCSVRSCRYYFPIFALGYDALYCCFGANATLGYPTLKRLKMDYYDGKSYGTLLFDRDKERRKHYALEHTGYLKGGNIPEAMKKDGKRTDLLESKTGTAFSFKETVSPVSDKKCLSAEIRFSKAYYSTFKYSEEKGVYYKYHSGQKHMDSAAKSQLSYTNLFILQTDVHVYKDGKIMEVDWKGGDGYYVSQGTVTEITWKKPSEQDYVTYYDKSTGKELNVNPGKSYIAVCNKGQTTLSETK